MPPHSTAGQFFQSLDLSAGSLNAERGDEMSLSQNEIYYFNNELCGEKMADEIPGHSLTLTYYKTTIGIKGAVCSCGKRFQMGHVGNRSGAAYQRLGLKEAWNKHVAAVKKVVGE